MDKLRASVAILTLATIVNSLSIILLTLTLGRR